MVHRWTRGADIVALLWILRQMLEQSGSIEGFFAEGYDPDAVDVGGALDSFSRRALALDLHVGLRAARAGARRASAISFRGRRRAAAASG